MKKSKKKSRLSFGAYKIRLAPAFTLIELLMIIAMITILASLLFPALQGAKEKTNEIVCRHNLKQIAATLLIYASDNNGWLVPARPTMTGPEGTGGYYWTYPASYFSVGLGPKLHLAKDIFMCPHVKKRPTLAQAWYGDYAMRYDDYAPLYNETAVKRPLVKIDKIPSKTMFITDNGNVAVAFHWQFWIPEMRHSNGINALCGDMHIERVRQSAFANSYIYGINK